ncbi:MAG: hypothetical protein HQK83_08020, partial [Fibrobacteria bacterium]|nr:hypothetical protein [Fibrobacteria bacterium]
MFKKTLLLLGLAEAFANFNVPLNRPYTLRNQTPFLLEAEFHRVIAEDTRYSLIYPRACISPLDSSQVCKEKPKFRLRNKEKELLLQIRPIIGTEYRYIEQNISNTDFGLIISGFKGPASFYLDARMFTEVSKEIPQSYDREYIDSQSVDNSDFIAYNSFARYRSNFSYDMKWGRVTVAHDAVHWGPGLFTNLNFHQNAIPLNYLSFSTNIGPFSIISLYGQPLYQNARGGDISNERSLYAHRYEYAVTSNLLFSITELLFLVNYEEPFAFVPIVPLFMHKDL